MERLKLAVPRRDLRIFGRRITKIIQNEIRRQDLIDTGNLLRSIKTKVTNSRGKMKVDVTGIDYLKYVDGNFDILGKVKRGRAYKEVEKDFNELNKK
tara:strand:+ start:4834 stop:5124 length:291 start_codon:yes stop_codon:yes gene_type:complete